MHNRDSYGVVGEGVGSAVALFVVIVILAAYAFVKASSLIIHTFVKYPRKVILWVFLAGFIVSIGVGAFIAQITQNSAFVSYLGLAGFVTLTLVCYIVQLRDSQTFIKQPEPMVKAVLGSSWWSDDTQKAAA